MKRFIKKVYLLMGIGLTMLAVCFVAYKIVPYQLFAVKHITVTVDQFFAPDTQKEIMQTIYAVTGLGDVVDRPSTAWQSALLAAQLHARFPCIKTVTVAFQPGSCAQVNVLAHRPQFCIGNQVATDSGILMFKKYFLSEHIDLLRAVCVQLPTQQEAQLPVTCHHCLTSLTAAMLDKYDFSWQSDGYIWLRDKEEKKFLILFSDQSFPNDSILHVCDSIKNELVSRRTKKSSQLEWVADIRFKNQIVVFTQRGG